MQANVQSVEIEIIPDLSQYGIHDVTEIYYNPSYELLFTHETDASLSGHERATITESGAVSVNTGEFTGPLSQRQISGEGRYNPRHGMVV